MQIDLTGKTAIVTGSTGGIGFAIAKGLAESGATVVVNGRKQYAVNDAWTACASRCRMPMRAAWPPTSAVPMAARPCSPPSPRPISWSTTSASSASGLLRHAGR